VIYFAFSVILMILLIICM